MQRARIVRAYRTQYANPIRFAAGEIVTLGARDTEWPAFIWTITADGNAGWAPFDWLKPLGDGRAESLRDYSARELDVIAGDDIVLHHQLGGWWWCGHADGRCGWVPNSSIQHEASTMKFGYTIVYVNNVDESLAFFERAFGFSRRFLHESGDYGELETGETTLAFAASALAEINIRGGVQLAHACDKPLGIEIAFVCEDVGAAHRRAMGAGAYEVSVPSEKPWGQTVSYVSHDNVLIELCTPVMTAGSESP